MARFDLGIAAGFGLDALAEAGMLAGASLDMDFAGNRIYGASSFTSTLAITRASTGYAESAAGVWSSFASGALRITDKGELPEEARTNSIRNNSMQGAVAGTPGTLPTNWTQVATGLARQIVGTGVEDGIDYVDIRIFGTSGANEAYFTFEPNTYIAALAGQVWTSSFFAKFVGGSLTNIVNGENYIIESNSGGGLAGASSTTFSYSGTQSKKLSECRVSHTRTLTGGTTAYVVNRIDINFSAASGQAIDVTIRIGWPQLEQGAFATSPIRTTSAAATRAADVVTVNSPSNYLSLSSGSAYVEWDEVPGAVGAQRTLLSIRVTDNDRILVRIHTDNKVQFIVVSGGVEVARISSTNAVAAAGRYKAAVRWGLNDFAARYYGLGAQPANDTGGAVPTGTFAVNIGHGNSDQQPNDYLRRIALFKSALTDAQLEALVA